MNTFLVLSKRIHVVSSTIVIVLDFFLFFWLHGGLKLDPGKDKRTRECCKEPFGHEQQHQGHSNKLGRHSKASRNEVYYSGILN